MLYQIAIKMLSVKNKKWHGVTFGQQSESGEAESPHAGKNSPNVAWHAVVMKEATGSILNKSYN